MRKFSRCLLFLMVLCLSVSAAGDNLGQAWRRAALYVPASAMPEGMKDLEMDLVFYFLDELKQQRYEVILDKDSKLLREIILTALAPSSTGRISPAQLRQLLALRYPGTLQEGLYTTSQAGSPVFFAALFDLERSTFYRAVLDPRSGDTLQLSFNLVSPQDEGELTPLQARTIALEYIKGAQIVDFRYELIAGGSIYLITLYSLGEEHQLTISAWDGRVLGQLDLQSELEPVPDDNQDDDAFDDDDDDAFDDDQDVDDDDEGDEDSTDPPAFATPLPSSTPRPTLKPSPSLSPTLTPSPSPSPKPTLTPSPSPSPKPTLTPSPSPSPSPTITPSPSPSPKPTLTPSPSPSPSPTITPSPSPSPNPTPDFDDD